MLSLIVLFLPGCGEAPSTTQNDPTTKPEPEKKKELPKIPGAEAEEQAGATEIVIKDTTYAQSRKKDEYVQNDKLPAGTIEGLCFIASSAKSGKPAPPEPLTLEGAYAIKDPQNGELDYYRNLKVTARKPDAYLGNGPGRLGNVGVWGVVLSLSNVKTGKRAPMSRPSFLVQKGQFGASWGSYSASNFSFSALAERANVGTYDAFPCRAVFTFLSTKKQIFEGDVVSYDPAGKKPLGGGGVEYARPTMAQSLPLMEPGMYQLTCARHPWQNAYLLVHDNPYVCVVQNHHDANQVGRFSMGDVPVGKHKLIVWHPVYEAVRREIDVELKENETTQIAVELKQTHETR